MIAISPFSRAALPADTVTLARFLLGKLLIRELDGGQAIGRIVETEAYLENDPACHAYRGITKRNRSLFLEVGHAYVYVCYGTHYLLNVSSGAHGAGSGVLLRSLEPVTGIALMRRNPTVRRAQDLTRGPGRLTAAMRVDLQQDGIDLCTRGPLWLGDDGGVVEHVGESVRIGLTKGADSRLRFFVVGSVHLSGSRRLNTHSP